MPSIAEKIVIAVRLRSKLLAFRLRQSRQLRHLLKSALPSNETCPICASTETVTLSFTLPNETVEKSLCRNCEHLFSNLLQTELRHVEIVFKVTTENEGSATQLALLEELTAKLEQGTFLDFGIGGNLTAFQAAGKRLPQHRFQGCDVYPSSAPGYFVTYSPDAPLGIFDGISSYAVIEHLTNTVDAWRLLNRLLKPINDGGGIMIHSFPSQWHLDFDDWAIQIAGHSCLFSRKSLKLLCDKMGFAIERADPPRFVGPHYHPVFRFRKIRDA